MMSSLRGKLTDPLLSVVMPVYNERDTIEEIIGRVLAVPIRIELIVVDDGSPDGTRDILERLRREHAFKLVLQPMNQGKGAALRRGFAEVTGEVVVIQDADLEYSPEELPSLIELICEGRADVVYGSRFLGRHRVFLFTHYVGNRLLTLITNVLYNTMLTDMETCYKAMRTEVLRSFTLESNGFGIEPEMTAKIFKRRLPGLRGADHVRRARLRRRQEDYLARRAGRAVGAAQVPVHRVTAFLRLLRYARPYRLRLAWAVVAMTVYAVGSAGLAYLVKPIFDSVLPEQRHLALIAGAIVGVYFLKGVGSYVSSYLMADVGQRVVMDLRTALFRHILGQSAGFFARRTTGQLMSRINNDVAPGAAGGLGDGRRPGARVARARRLHAACCSTTTRGWRSSASTLRAARRLPAGAAGPAGPQHDAPQPGGAGAPVARERRGVHRPSHRQGVRHRGGRGREVRPRELCALPDEHEGDGGAGRACRR